MPMRSGWSRSPDSASLRSSSFTAMRRAASSAWRQAICRRAVEAEQRHHAVADELVEPAAGRLDRLADGAEIAVEQEHHVVGQLALGDRGEAADVGEQDRDVALAAMCLRLPAIGVDRPGGGRQQGRDAIAAGRRPELAGEPDIGRRADPRQHLLLLRLGRRQRTRRRRRCARGRSSSGRARRIPRHAGCRRCGSSRGSVRPAAASTILPLAVVRRTTPARRSQRSRSGRAAKQAEQQQRRAGHQAVGDHVELGVAAGVAAPGRA